ncbi:MAG: SRPBCC family protein [Muribaculaceae bacterium]|nr:SRPBCC family protein [Muribaculaceae bacterium]
MAVFKSQIQTVQAPAEAVFDKLSDLSNLKSLLAQVPADAVPADQKDMFEAIRVTEDSISFPAGPVGELTMRMTRKERPTLITLEGVGAPVALSMNLEIGIVAADVCEAVVAIDIAIPAMLKPMIGGTLQKMADQFGEMIGRLNYD